MFNIVNAIEKNKQFQIIRTNGYKLEYKKIDKGIRISDKQKQEIADSIEKQAEIESQSIINSFKNKSMDFGLRLSKARGQRHRVGGVA